MGYQHLKGHYPCRGYVCSSIRLRDREVLVVTLRRDKRFKDTCPIGRSTRLRIHRRWTGIARDLQFGFAMTTELHYPATQAYGIGGQEYRTFRPDLVHPQNQATRRFMDFAADLCRDMPARKVAERLGLAPATVRAYEKEVLQKRLPLPKLDGIRALLVDEKAVRRGPHYVTVAMNPDTREGLFMEEGRKKETLLAFLNRLNPTQKASIRVVGIDRGGSYLAAVKEALPEADVVFDRFRIIQNLNGVLDEVRRSEYRKAEKKRPSMAKLIRGQRYNLFRLAENRTPAQTVKLQALRSANEALSKAHVLSEPLRLLWTYHHRGYAERFLRNWVTMAEERGIEPMARFARGLWRNRAGIVNYAYPKVTSGPLEAMNGTLERLIRRACGMQDIHYLFLKVRQASLP